MSTLRTNYEPSPGTQEELRTVASGGPVSAIPAPYLVASTEESLRVDDLSIALIGPEEKSREVVVRELEKCARSEVCTFDSYPPSIDDAPMQLKRHHDVIIVELDSDPEYALDLVESIGSNAATTVMVYSAADDPDLLVRCMRAGAREFLKLPLEPGTLAESLTRAVARRPVAPPTFSNRKKKNGRLLVFMGAKGGAGVTTLACNFAVALAQDPKQKTLLIDLDLPFGDAALNLGIIAEFSTIDALHQTERLDGSFLSRLVVGHSSGVFVLAAPGRFQPCQSANEAVDKLITVARQEFDNVVVDMGSRIDLTETVLFNDAANMYLVTQSGIPELRNSNRLISHLFSDGGPNLEVVINRHEERMLGVSEKDITKALTRPAHWKIPNDYASVRRMQVDAIPLVLGNSLISRQIREMARAATGQPAPEAKKRIFSFLR